MSAGLFFGYLKKKEKKTFVGLGFLKTTTTTTTPTTTTTTTTTTATARKTLPLCQSDQPLDNLTIAMIFSKGVAVLCSVGSGSWAFEGRV